MSLGENKRALGQGKVEKSPQNTDPSMFKGRQEIDRGKFNFQVTQDQRLFETTKLDQNRREKLIKEITARYGSSFAKIEAEEAERELNKGSAGKFKDFPLEKREAAKKLMNGILGK